MAQVSLVFKELSKSYIPHTSLLPFIVRRPWRRAPLTEHFLTSTHSSVLAIGLLPPPPPRLAQRSDMAKPIEHFSCHSTPLPGALGTAKHTALATLSPLFQLLLNISLPPWFPTRGEFVLLWTWDILDHYNLFWGCGVCYWHLAGRGQGFCQTSCNSQDTPWRWGIYIIRRWQPVALSGVLKLWNSTRHRHAQLCPIFCDPRDCSPPGSSVHGILQARILKWVAISPRGSSRPRDWTYFSFIICIGRQVLYH